MRWGSIRENPAYDRWDIGEHSYGRPIIKEWAGGDKLKIGKFCSIAPDVVLCLGGQHHDNWVTTYPFHGRFKARCKKFAEQYSKGDLIIGNDVWIGYAATILSGVTIGDGAIIGAKSVVAKDLPPYAVAVGNPVEIKRKRFSDDIIDKLLEIKWWNWNLKKILDNAEYLMSDNIERFVEMHYGK